MVIKMNIKDLEIGKSANITKVGGEGALRQHFLDMGLIPGAQITMMKYAPMGDPVEIKIHGYELTLRLADAEKIEIDTPFEIKNIKDGSSRKKDISHPGLGEGGKFHTKADENPLPDGTLLTFALAGNQNCGKTTLFNRLKGIINIVDASNIERNLYLTMQLMELDIPMVIALNMMDEVRKNGGSILVNEMEQLLGVPVIPISAAKNEGIE